MWSLFISLSIYLVLCVSKSTHGNVELCKRSGTLGLSLINLSLMNVVRAQQNKVLTYSITKTWDGETITSHSPIQITIGPADHVAKNVKITAAGPFFNDPANPGGTPGQPFNGLWDYEVAEAFFLNDQNQYIEIELSPHGQHLVLLLNGRRNAFRTELPLNYTAAITGNTWQGVAYVPWEYFPPKVSKFNAYAIHGSNDTRTYEALYPVPRGKFTDPDFHKLEYFRPIDFHNIIPSNGMQSYSSDLWKQAVPFGK